MYVSLTLFRSGEVSYKEGGGRGPGVIVFIEVGGVSSVNCIHCSGLVASGFTHQYYDEDHHGDTMVVEEVRDMVDLSSKGHSLVY